MTVLDVPKILEDLGIEVMYVADSRAVARCPLRSHEHDDTKPGFSVLLETGRWVCFKGCGGPADLWVLVQRLQGSSQGHAEGWLIKRGAELNLEGLMASLTVSEPRAGREPQLQLMRADYDRQDPNTTSSYILGRGFTPRTIRDWGIRLDHDVPALVIPVFNTEQVLVGIIRRELVTGALPSKYFTSPGYDRDRYLFGENKHPRNGKVVLVEGPLDAIWLHQCGIPEAVALLGTFCSRRQERVIASLGSTVWLALDNDEAGRTTVEKLTPRLSRKFGVRLIRLPESVKDVQELSKDQVQRVFKEVVVW